MRLQSESASGNLILFKQQWGASTFRRRWICHILYRLQCILLVARPQWFGPIRDLQAGKHWQILACLESDDREKQLFVVTKWWLLKKVHMDAAVASVI